MVHQTIKYAIIFILIGFIFGNYQDGLPTKLDDKYAFDYWSIAHIFVMIGVFLIIFVLNKQNAINISIIISVGFEIFENIIGRTIPIFYKIAYEIPANFVADILCDFIGIVIGYYFIKKYK